MGINRPSLYATFGNKHGLFLTAIDRYAAVQGMAQSAPLREEPNIRNAVAGYYRQIVKTVASGDSPRGCLIGSVATEVAERDLVVREKIAGNLAQSEQVLDQRLAESAMPMAGGAALSETIVDRLIETNKALIGDILNTDEALGSAHGVRIRY